MAELLHGKCETDKAREKTTLVFNRAETDALLGRAAKVSWHVVRIGLADRALAGEHQRIGFGASGADRYLALTGSTPGIARRSPDARDHSASPDDESLARTRRALLGRAEDLRERIGKAKDDPAFRQCCGNTSSQHQGLDDDERVFALTEKILETERQGSSVAFREELTFLRRLGPQWDSVPLSTK